MANRALTCCLGFVASVAVVCGGGYFGIRALLGNRLNAQLTASRAKARAAGLYVTLEEFVLPTIPDAMNAAIDYRRAFAFMKEHRSDLTRFDSTSDPTRPQLPAAELDKLFKTMSPAIAAFEAGANRPHLNWKRDWSQGWSMPIPEFAELKRLTRLVGARAKVRANQGDMGGAIADLRKLGAVLRQVSEEPTAMANRTRMVIEEQTLRTTMDVLSIHPFDPTLLAEAKSVVESFGPVTDVDSLLRTEIVLMLASMRRMESSSADEFEQTFLSTDDQRAQIHHLRSANFRTATTRRWLDAYTKILESRRKLGADLHAWSKEARIVEQDEFLDDDGVRSFERLGTTPSSVGDTASNQIAMRRAAIWLIDSLQASARAGAQRFIDVKPTPPPQDPFVAAPMHFAKRPGYILAYSVGRDEFDNGGDVLTSGQLGPDVGLAIGDLPHTRSMGGGPPGAAGAPPYP